MKRFVTIFFSLTVLVGVVAIVQGVHAQVAEPPLTLNATASPDPADTSITISVNGSLSGELAICDFPDGPPGGVTYVSQVAKTVIGGTVNIVDDTFQGQSISVSVSPGTDGSCGPNGPEGGSESTYSGFAVFDTTGLSDGNYKSVLEVEDGLGAVTQKTLWFDVEHAGGGGTPGGGTDDGSGDGGAGGGGGGLECDFSPASPTVGQTITVDTNGSHTGRVRLQTFDDGTQNLGDCNPDFIGYNGFNENGDTTVCNTAGAYDFVLTDETTAETATCDVTVSSAPGVPSGTISASPVPCILNVGETTCDTTLSWTTSGGVDYHQVWGPTNKMRCESADDSYTHLYPWVTEAGKTITLYDTLDASECGVANPLGTWTTLDTEDVWAEGRGTIVVSVVDTNDNPITADWLITGPGNNITGTNSSGETYTDQTSGSWTMIPASTSDDGGALVGVNSTNCSLSTPDCTESLDNGGTVTYELVYEPDVRTFEMEFIGTGSGLVTFSPEDNNMVSTCTGDCTLTYDRSIEVTVTATADPGDEFETFYNNSGNPPGGTHGDNPVTTTMTNAKTWDVEFNAGATLSIIPTAVTVAEGSTQQFTAEYDPDGIPSSGDETDVTASASWQSDDTGVAQHNSGGLFDAVGLGTAGITAQYMSTNSNTAQMTVVELVLEACSDGVDNDGDGFIDFPNDPGCESLADDDELNETDIDEI